MPRLSTEVVIQQIEEKQPGKYGFDKLEYKNYRGKITLFCNVHKEYFETTFLSAITTNSCKQCIKEDRPTRTSHTKERFVARALEVHGDSYCYRDADYVNSQTKVNIWCKRHNSYFSQIPNSHVQGVGCPTCGVEHVSTARNSSAKTHFIEKAIKVSPQYDYSKVVYKTAHVKVEVVCDKHQSFWVRPTNILRGVGCPECFAENRGVTQVTNAGKDYLSKIANVFEHQDKGYSYPNFVYRGLRNKIVVNCPVHKEFTVSAGNHLSGKGCPSCAKNGYQKDKPGFLYVLTCGEITKIGITNRKVSSRLREISKSFGKTFEILRQYYFENGKCPHALEQILLGDLRSRYKQPDIKFEGSTESFLSVERDVLINDIESLIKEQNSSIQASQEA